MNVSGLSNNQATGSRGQNGLENHRAMFYKCGMHPPLNRSRGRNAFAAAAWALFLSLAGCPKPPPPPPAAPTVADLNFPAAVLYTSSSCVVYKDAADLGVMNISFVINAKSPPVLIDSKLNIFTLEKLRSTHGDLWLMATCGSWRTRWGTRR
jgi:hypothetical protein